MITLVVHVDDKPGVLNRVVSLVRRRAFNIASLTVSHTEATGVSRITLVVDSPPEHAARLRFNLYKLVPVLAIDDVTDEPSVLRDLALIKVRADAAARPQILQIVQLLDARVLDVSPESLIVELASDEEKIDDLVELLRPFGILDLARTGRLAMGRGATASADALAAHSSAYAASSMQGAA
jgi:acetolactate synthase-1/3 small subunit